MPKDGGSTTITFDLNGSKAVASFRVVFNGASFDPGPATLAAGGATSDLTRLAAPPDGAAYTCF